MGFRYAVAGCGLRASLRYAVAGFAALRRCLRWLRLSAGAFGCC
ncbi:MAG: hypothetical protein ACNA8W_03570 [Bradymonadaceae bacterium]